LEQILFFDASGNQLSDATYTLVPGPAPEPSAWLLWAIGLMFFLMLTMRGMRFRFADTCTEATGDDV
jgi:hypothetical protein